MGIPDDGLDLVKYFLGPVEYSTPLEYSRRARGQPKNHDFSLIFWILAQKLIFERLYGLGMPKIYFWKVQKFFENFRKKIFKIFLWGTFKRNFKIALLQKISFSGAERPKIAHDPKNRFFQSPIYQYRNPTTEKETSN